MAATLHSIEALPEEFFNDIMDKGKITKDWLLISSPYPIGATLLIYLIIVIKMGPGIMKSRDPFELKTAMRLYNVFQIFYNTYIFHSMYAYPKLLSTLIENTCEVKNINDRDDLKYAFLYYSWHYLMLKIVDLTDTVFMVLRKKNSHITFLHVYHHIGMVFFTWLTLSYTKSLHAVAPVFVNIVVHMIMYSYYFLATFPQLKKYMWWKRHLTKLQLGQFFVVLMYIFFIYYNGCLISRVFTYTWIFNVLVILVLFINFYVKSYFVKSSATDEHVKSS